MLQKPDDLYDRAWEWDALARFVDSQAAGPRLGVVFGRRRQGKSLLLHSMCEATGGFYHVATQTNAADALAQLGRGLGHALGAPTALHLSSWDAAVRAIFELGAERSRLVVLDEFAYLVAVAPELPSLIQRALGPGGEGANQTRLILCGSAVSFMGRLLSGEAPLRGRASLEMVVRPFDFRAAAGFWGLEHGLHLAARVHAIVGGTPAYRREFVDDDAPAGDGDFDAWVVRAVLNPARPLFREGRYLLAEEPDLRDAGLYHATLAALASGRTARGAIAAALGRPSHDISHPLSVLEDVRLVERRRDLFRKGRPTYAIVEPFIRFHHAIIHPRWSRLARPGSAQKVWAASQDAFASQILGPHFESLARTWVRDFAAPSTVGGELTEVGAGVVHDPKARRGIEVDVVGRDQGGVRLLGEAKWGHATWANVVARLSRARALLAERGLLHPDGCKLALFGASGFTGAAKDDEMLRVGLEDLYRRE